MPEIEARPARVGRAAGHACGRLPRAADQPEAPAGQRAPAPERAAGQDRLRLSAWTGEQQRREEDCQKGCSEWYHLPPPPPIHA